MALKVDEFIRLPPSDGDALVTLVTKFSELGDIPNVIGAIDCTHVAISRPMENEHVYLNRKQFHSINVQAVCGADLIFMDVCARFPRSMHDSFILGQLSLSAQFKAASFARYSLLGDSTYPLKRWLLTPVGSPILMEAEKEYNKCHRKMQCVVERAFGVFKSRFQCLTRHDFTFKFAPAKCALVTTVAMMMHNYAIRQGLPLPDNEENGEEDDAADEEGAPDAVDVNGRAYRDHIIESRFA